MSEYVIKKTEQKIILHDCVITHMQLKSDCLEISFENGFWLMPEHEENPTENIIRTGPSKLQFFGIDLEWAYILFYKEHRLFRKIISTTVQYVSLEKMIDWINKGRYRFEIIQELYGSFCSFDGFIHSRRRACLMEARMTFLFQKAICTWDNIRPDCTF